MTFSKICQQNHHLEVWKYREFHQFHPICFFFGRSLRSTRPGGLNFRDPLMKGDCYLGGPQKKIPKPPGPRPPINNLLGGGFKHFCMFTGIWGRWTHFDVRIFFRWVVLSPPTRFVDERGKNSPSQNLFVGCCDFARTCHWEMWIIWTTSRRPARGLVAWAVISFFTRIWLSCFRGWHFLPIYIRIIIKPFYKDSYD